MADAGLNLEFNSGIFRLRLYDGRQLSDQPRHMDCHMVDGDLGIFNLAHIQNIVDKA